MRMQLRKMNVDALQVSSDVDRKWAASQVWLPQSMTDGRHSSSHGSSHGLSQAAKLHCCTPDFQCLPLVLLSSHSRRGSLPQPPRGQHPFVRPKAPAANALLWLETA